MTGNWSSSKVMEWCDSGIVLNAKKFGESSIIAHVMTSEHGRCAGFVNGFNSKKQRGVIQPGNEVHVCWRARLEENLGRFAVELIDSHAARVLLDAGRLSAVLAACSMVNICLPEREPYPNLFIEMRNLLTHLPDEGWLTAYVNWEISLLAELGFGLDLSHCASTGTSEDLIYVSPKSGRAVSAEAGRPYRERLLPLPQFLVGRGKANEDALLDGLRLTGYFLERHVFSPHGTKLPDPRATILQIISD